MNILNRYNESVNNSILKCTKNELEEYLLYGIILQQGSSYYDRKLNKLKVEYPNIFNIDLSDTINICIKRSKDCHFKRIFCMSEQTYNNYKYKGYIFIKNNIEYYRNLNEDWVVHLLK